MSSATGSGRRGTVASCQGVSKVCFHNRLVSGNLAGPLVRGGKSDPPLKRQLEENERRYGPVDCPQDIFAQLSGLQGDLERPESLSRPVSLATGGSPAPVCDARRSPRLHPQSAGAPPGWAWHGRRPCSWEERARIWSAQGRETQRPQAEIGLDTEGGTASTTRNAISSKSSSPVAWAGERGCLLAAEKAVEVLLFVDLNNGTDGGSQQI